MIAAGAKRFQYESLTIQLKQHSLQKCQQMHTSANKTKPNSNSLQAEDHLTCQLNAGENLLNQYKHINRFS